MIGIRAAIVLCLAILIGGCAANSIRIESAGAVSAASSAMVVQARAALDEARLRRDQANAALVASDPSCEPLTRLGIYTRGDDWRSDLPPAPLCADGSTQLPGYDIAILDLRPIPTESLRPTLLLIAAVADYGGALGKIVERPDADIEKELAALAEKAGEAKAIADGLFGSDLPDPVKALASDQAKAAIALLEFVEGFVAEARKVKDIRKLVADRGRAVDAVIPELRAQLATWLLVSGQGDSQIISNALKRAYAEERSTIDFEKRLAFVQLVNQSRADVESFVTRKQALDQALTLFAKAQTELRDALVGKFTEEQRREIARRNRANLLRGIGLIARAVLSFGGL